MLEPLAEVEHDRRLCPVSLIRLVPPGSSMSCWPGSGPWPGRKTPSPRCCAWSWRFARELRRRLELRIAELERRPCSSARASACSTTSAAPVRSACSAPARGRTTLRPVRRGVSSAGRGDPGRGSVWIEQAGGGAAVPGRSSKTAGIGARISW